MKSALANTFRALRHRNYRIFFIGQGLSQMGTWLQQVAMGWLVYRLTGSAWLLGVVAFCSNAGILLFGNLAGVLTDRVNKRHALLITQSLLLAQALVLAALTALGIVTTGELIALALVLGTIQAFDLPLRQTLYVHILDDRADLTNAIALNSLLVNGARVIGPALAGILIAVTTEATCFALNALSFTAVLYAIVKMRYHEEDRPRDPTGWWSSWLEGAHYVFGHPTPRALMTLIAILAFCVSPYSSLMPVFAKDIYGGGPHTLGYLLSAAGLGALLSTAHLAGRRSVHGLGRVIAIAAAVSGVALLGFAYVRVLPIALVLLFCVGGGVILAAASSNTILQTLVDDRLRGRVMSFYTLAFVGVAPLGNLSAGAVAGWIGAPNAFAINGAVAAVGAAWFWRKLPQLRAALRPPLETELSK